MDDNLIKKVSKIVKHHIMDTLNATNKENRIPEESSKKCLKYECSACSKINFVYGSLSENTMCDFCSHSLIKVQCETEDPDERDNERGFSYSFYECDQCKDNFTSKKDLLGHLKTHLKERARTKRKSTAKNDEDKSRRKKRSKLEKPFKCDEENCQYATSQYSLLKSHKFKHNPFFKCVTCQEKFSSRLELKNHMSSHGERPFKCDQCNKCYKDKHGLGWHKKVQHEPSRLKFTCELCGKTYPFDSLLTQHINLTHAAEKQTVCDICGKNVSKTYLPMHRRTHGEKQYSCDVCEKTFLEKAYLKRHKMVHTGEKPYVCSVCGNSFRQHSTLTIHMRTHTGDRPYKCVLCENAYKTHHNLKKHYKRSGHKIV